MSHTTAGQQQLASFLFAYCLHSGVIFCLQFYNFTFTTLLLCRVTLRLNLMLSCSYYKSKFLLLSILSGCHYSPSTGQSSTVFIFHTVLFIAGEAIFIKVTLCLPVSTLFSPPSPWYMIIIRTCDLSSILMTFLLLLAARFSKPN